MNVRIVIDAMGTDLRPVPDVAGAMDAIRNLPQQPRIILVGNETVIKDELAKHRPTSTEWQRISIVDAPHEIAMSDKPAAVVKQKEESSIHVGIKLVKDRDADAFITAGNTGATLAISLVSSSAVGRIKGVKRPALAAIPRLWGHTITVLDVGANTDTRLEWLIEFGLMGNIYSRDVLKVNQPRVGLLSNGEEEGKGNQLVKDALAPFKQLPLNFIGNIEPSDLITGKVDVIVCDGYVGNILIKTFESSVKKTLTSLRDELTSDTRAKIGGMLARPALRRLRNNIDPNKFGGAPLLGLNGLVFIGHGSADRVGIASMVAQAQNAINANLIERLEEGLASYNGKQQHESP